MSVLRERGRERERDVGIERERERERDVGIERERERDVGIERERAINVIIMYDNVPQVVEGNANKVLWPFHTHTTPSRNTS